MQSPNPIFACVKDRMKIIAVTKQDSNAIKNRVIIRTYDWKMCFNNMFLFFKKYFTIQCISKEAE